MSRWFLLLCCGLTLVALASIEPPARAADAGPLGSACTVDRDCLLGLECVYEAGVMEAQCAARCNETAACQEDFGTASMCLGADLCARTCQADADCPEGAVCNAYGWCEAR